MTAAGQYHQVSVGEVLRCSRSLQTAFVNYQRLLGKVGVAGEKVSGSFGRYRETRGRNMGFPLGQPGDEFLEGKSGFYAQGVTSGVRVGFNQVVVKTRGRIAIKVIRGGAVTGQNHKLAVPLKPLIK